MKKLLLILSIFVISLSALAADLNPFAYGLRSSVNALNPMQLDIQFSINAPATSVKVVVYDIATKTDVYTYSCTAYNAKHDYALSLDLSEIPGQYRGGVDNLGWRVDVKGAAVNTPTVIDQEYYLYHPRSIDIDNNPENPNFGHVFVIEGLHDITTKKGTTNGASGKPYNEYLSWGLGAGLYVFDAAFRNLPTPNATAGYNGGITYTAAEKITVNESGYNVYAPNRVHVSDDGRVFITLCAPVDRGVLFEADKYIFSDAEDRPANWSATGWKKVLVGTRDANTEELEDASGKFIAALNCDIDTKGSGENLQIMLLSGTKNALQAVSGQYTFSEYNIGESSTWTTVPTNKWTLDNTVVAYNVAQIVYDNEGGYWFCQHRGSSSDAIKFPTLMHVNKEGVVDLREKMLNRGGAGICFNKDFTKLIVSGKSSNKSISGVSTATSYTTGTAGWATIYKVDKENGKPKLTMEYEIDMTSIGNNLPGFAWDHANNIYACGYSHEKLKAWALPRTADEVVSTPAASRFAFEVNCASDESYVINVTADATRGSATITAGFDAEGKVPACNPVEVFAQSKDGYKFVCWKEGSTAVSTDNPYTFSAVKDVTLTAHFEEGDYTVTWWNLFKEGQDISKPEYDTKWNTRLWRLYQAQFEGYIDKLQQQGVSVANRNDKGYVTGYEEYDVAGFITERFGQNANYLSADVSNETTPFAWLGEYIEHVNGKEIVYKNSNATLNARWAYMLYMFINRTTIARATNGGDVTYFASPDYTDKNFIEYGQPEHWRPWWSDRACDLPKTVGSEKRLPITWKKLPCSTLTVKNDAGTVIGTPADWYQWNTALRADQLLAWRDGSVTGDIVHYVYRDNMKLYATYVDTRLQEEDPTPDLTKDPYDATNNDVLSLLNNQNYGTTPHNVTMDRKFAGGMYNTICLPFDLPISHLPDELKNADIRVFNSVTETYTESGDPVAVLNFITLDEYWDNWNAAHPDKTVADENRYMEAGIAYLIKPEADVNKPYLTYSGLPYWRFFDGTRMPYGTYADYVSFQGVLNPTTLPENAYILVADNRLAKVTNTSDKILGYRGYFVIDDAFLRSMADQGNLYFSFQKPVTTSIPVAPEAEQQTKPQVRKIMYDGKIYILRGDEVYTITGHRVK
ncbi:MAG: hypothetical protein IKV31_06470 [Paludibacteraceae bacterium]|nr:hypothetical protein [Paludibacteraceae bacterium]